MVIINVKPHVKENHVLAKSVKSNKASKFYGKIFKLTHIFRRVSNTKTHYTTQKEAFDAAMKYLLLSAQIIGLFPFKENTTSKVRWASNCWRYALCIFMTIIQLLAAILSFQNLVSSTVTITKIAHFSFYLITFISTISFLRLSTKWNHLMRHLETVRLNEYIDPYIQHKCNFAVTVSFSLAFVEYALTMIMKWMTAKNCYTGDGYNILKSLIKTNFYWLYDLGVQYSISSGIYFQIQNFSITIVWSYMHIFVICMSLYLSSILVQLNKVIMSREGEYLPSSYWRKLREDYNRATQLVRLFDDSINSIVLTSFSSNLLFLCLQIYFLLSNGIPIKTCSNPDIDAMKYDNTTSLVIHSEVKWSQYQVYKYVFPIYVFLFILLRSYAVALFAARVHTESLAAIPTLYSVPSPTFCTEVQRFIEQIRSNTVALTGLNFFYVTKELILSVVGTIVTYELVLLQFGKT